MAASEPTLHLDVPQQFDLDKCVHCGLCLNACPTYRELGLEADSPRGRVYQMVQVATGAAPISESYIHHIDLCLACRGCESACPSGVQYGRLVEAARAQIAATQPRPLLSRIVLGGILPSRALIRSAAALMAFYQRSGLRSLVRSSGLLKMLKLADAEALSPEVETPHFYRHYGKVYPAEGTERYRVALLGGCIANVFFARLNEATLAVLRKNGCEVSIPESQTCCGALHVHAGLRDEARALARKNIDALVDGGYDAIITNAAGCGSTLKEYHELFENDERARRFSTMVKDVNEFLSGIELNTRDLKPLPVSVTYQDSCHLAHGQKIRAAPRMLLKSIPGLELREMPLADLCCGSAGIYNVVQPEMSMALLEKKMANVEISGADVIATANPGCMLQLRAGARQFGRGQRVAHVVELLAESYGIAPKDDPR